MNRKKVLIIAYYFPPLGGAGVQRPLKFVKYLPEFGWDPVVLTVQRRYARLKDVSLEEEIPPNVPVYRTPAIIPPPWLPWRLRHLMTRWLLILDEQVGWMPFAVEQGKRILASHSIHAIMTTSSPYTTHLIGIKLKEWRHLPWLADFRDPWIGNAYYAYPTRFHENLARQWEQKTVYYSDQVIVVSEPMRQAMIERYPSLPEEKILTLPNGYDQEDFNHIETQGSDPDRLIITYTGSFYAHKRTPDAFLESLRWLLDQGMIDACKIRVNFVGDIGKQARERIASLGLTEIVQCVGYVSHQKSIGYLLGSDLLLLIVGKGPGMEAVYTGKIFEYLAANKPILALAPHGVVADLLHASQAGSIVPPDDIEAISTQIVNFYQQWEQGKLACHSNREFIARFERRKLTETLVHQLDKITRDTNS